MKIKTIKERIEKFEVVSFDIFDTLIKRNCDTYLDVYKACEKKIEIEYPNLHDFGFYSKRIKAEISSYRKNMCPTIDEIYEEMDISQDIKKQMKDIEIQMERCLVCPNYEMIEVYRYAIERGKKVIAISDMYLPRAVLMQLLRSVGIDIDKIFVSCEEGVNKTSGELFKRAIKEMDITDGKIIHIGDNFEADYKGAKKANIASIHYKKQIVRLNYFTNRNDKFLYPFILNNIQAIENPIQRLGYEVMGPIVYGFCKWIHTTAINEKYDVLLFCARDSYQTYNNYINMYPQERTKCKYVFISLKSLEAPYNACINKNVSPEDSKQLEDIRRYFEQIEIRGKVGIVDSGFGGHTQAMLQTIIGNRAELHGIYMRISNEYMRNVSDEKVAPYLYLKTRTRTLAKISGAFFEFLISATHGRTIGYKCVNGVISPILEDALIDSTIIENFQIGIQKFIDQWEAGEGELLGFDKKSVENSFFKFAFFPRKEHVQLLKLATHGNEVREQIVLECKNKKISKFLNALKETTWKGGFFVENTKFPKFLCRAYLMIDIILQKIIGF